MRTKLSSSPRLIGKLKLATIILSDHNMLYLIILVLSFTTKLKTLIGRNVKILREFPGIRVITLVILVVIIVWLW